MYTHTHHKRAHTYTHVHKHLKHTHNTHNTHTHTLAGDWAMARRPLSRPEGPAILEGGGAPVSEAGHA